MRGKQISLTGEWYMYSSCEVQCKELKSRLKWECSRSKRGSACTYMGCGAVGWTLIPRPHAAAAGGDPDALRYVKGPDDTRSRTGRSGTPPDESRRSPSPPNSSFRSFYSPECICILSRSLTRNEHVSIAFL